MPLVSVRDGRRQEENEDEIDGVDDGGRRGAVRPDARRDQTHVAIGVQIGRPAPVVVPAPVAVNAYRPPCPGPDMCGLTDTTTSLGTGTTGIGRYRRMQAPTGWRRGPLGATSLPATGEGRAACTVLSPAMSADSIGRCRSGMIAHSAAAVTGPIGSVAAVANSAKASAANDATVLLLV